MKNKKIELDKLINVTSITYQRNGVSGSAFYHVFFDYDMTDEFVDIEKPIHKMLGIVFIDEETCCAIVDLDMPYHCWRGDRFREPLMKKIKVKQAIDDIKFS